ncbi:MAG TPA: hypothetical protein DEP46_17375 [Blastocatellia bacterium]|nr:hypothetical protein [Blastocatellia bacterium]
MNLRIEPLTRIHNRKAFSCSDETVDQFLRQKAMQDQELDLSRTMVLTNTAHDPTGIIGYHTLAITQIPQEQIPNDRPKIKRGIPVILLGQLGIDSEYQGMGYGERMLTDAQSRVCDIAAKVGVRAMILDARTERLASWYESHGFIRLAGSMRMVKRIETIKLEFL